MRPLAGLMVASLGLEAALLGMSLALRAPHYLSWIAVPVVAASLGMFAALCARLSR